MKTYRVYFKGTTGIEHQDVEARGFTANSEGQLIFKVAKDGGIVAMFAEGVWVYFVVLSDGDSDE